MEVQLCTNCNSDNGGGYMAPAKLVIGWDNIVDSEVNTVWPVGQLCTPCLECVRHLDLEGLSRRHEERPRTMELP
jgi:hypothetical protein